MAAQVRNPLIPAVFLGEAEFWHWYESQRTKEDVVGELRRAGLNDVEICRLCSSHPKAIRSESHERPSKKKS